MIYHFRAVPLDNVEDCQYCKKAGAAFSTKCRACVVRWCASLPKDYRQNVYRMVKYEPVDNFIKDVKTCWEKNRGTRA